MGRIFNFSSKALPLPALPGRRRGREEEGDRETEREEAGVKLWTRN